jgi:hypothetical protein
MPKTRTVLNVNGCASMDLRSPVGDAGRYTPDATQISLTVPVARASANADCKSVYALAQLVPSFAPVAGA